MGAQENKKIIESFLTAIKEQDNRCTAPPYFYVIRTEEWIPYDNDFVTIEENNPGKSEKQVWICKEDTECQFDVKQEAIEYIIECDNDISEATAQEILAEEWNEVRFCRIWRERGMFLTHTDAESHFKRNRYHYSEHAHTYVKDAWRAPELEEFFKALFEYFGITAKWYYENKD